MHRATPIFHFSLSATATTLGIALLLAGCAPSATLQSPQTSLPAHWPVKVESATTSTTLPNWQSIVRDPLLHQLLEQARTYNHSLRLALLRVQEVQAAYGMQRAERLPTIGLGSSHARARIPGDLNPTGRSVVGSDHEVFVGLSSWELDLWERARSLSEAALQQYLATEAGARATQLAVQAQVARSYLALRELDERLELTRQTVASRADTLRIFTRRHTVGAISKYALTQVESLYNQARAIHIQLEQEQEQAAHALQLLTGANITQLPPQPANTQIVAEVPVGLPSSLLQARPDIVAAEHQLQAAHARVDAARAAFFPRIALTGSWGTASTELGGLFESGSKAWTFAPSLSLPLFDGGLRQSNLDLAVVRQHSAVVEYERTVQTAFREVSDALAARQALVQQVKIQQHNLATLQERARLAQLRYDNGASPYLDVLDAQRELLSAQQQLVQARYALQAASVSLYTALGGGPAVSTAPAATAAASRP